MDLFDDFLADDEDNPIQITGFQPVQYTSEEHSKLKYKKMCARGYAIEARERLRANRVSPRKSRIMANAMAYYPGTAHGPLARDQTLPMPTDNIEVRLEECNQLFYGWPEYSVEAVGFTKKVLNKLEIQNELEQQSLHQPPAQRSQRFRRLSDVRHRPSLVSSRSMRDDTSISTTDWLDNEVLASTRRSSISQSRSCSRSHSPLRRPRAV